MKVLFVFTSSVIVDVSKQAYSFIIESCASALERVQSKFPSLVISRECLKLTVSEFSEMVGHWAGPCAKSRASDMKEFTKVLEGEMVLSDGSPLRGCFVSTSFLSMNDIMSLSVFARFHLCRQFYIATV